MFDHPMRIKNANFDGRPKRSNHIKTTDPCQNANWEGQPNARITKKHCGSTAIMRILRASQTLETHPRRDSSVRCPRRSTGACASWRSRRDSRGSTPKSASTKRPSGPRQRTPGNAARLRDAEGCARSFLEAPWPFRFPFLCILAAFGHHFDVLLIVSDNFATHDCPFCTFLIQNFLQNHVSGPLAVCWYHFEILLMIFSNLSDEIKFPTPFFRGTYAEYRGHLRRGRFSIALIPLPPSPEAETRLDIVSYR